MPHNTNSPQDWSKHEAFDLLPADVRERLPKLYSQENVKDPTVHVRLFFPAGKYTAYVTEGQNEGTLSAPEWILFGYVVNMDSEFGYISLSELQELRAFGGLRMERDLSFKPCRLSQALKADRHSPHRADLDD